MTRSPALTPNGNASVTVTLLDTHGDTWKTLVIPMPAGFRWPAETTHVRDYLNEDGDVGLVGGVQINAFNPPEEPADA